MDKSDIASREDLLKRIDAVALEDTVVLRDALERYVSKRQAEDNYSIGEMGKLFILNRYLFNVPSSSELKQASFFGTLVLRDSENERYVNLLWPLKIENNGKLTLVGEFSGYFGPDFRAVEEFDYFNRRFGRRVEKTGVEKGTSLNLGRLSCSLHN